MTESTDRPVIGRAFRVAALVALPVGALLLAWWMTRAPADALAPVAEGHEHAAVTAAASGASQSVMLTAEQARRIGVTFAEVRREALAAEVRTVGQVVVDETSTYSVSLRFDGWVERLHVNATGQAVQAGDALLDIHSPMVVSAEEEFLLARRLAGNVAGGDARTRGGATDLESAARRRLEAWQVPEEEIARLERTGEVSRSLTLRALASGVVLEKAVLAGQRVMAGDALYRIADLTTVWIEAEIYEQDLREVGVGQATVATFDARPGERWSGRIAHVYPTLSTESRTARVRVVLANPGMRLKPGMFATLLIAGPRRPAVLTVPRSAVLVTGERTLVFVRRADGGLEPREVGTGARTRERIEILRGLAAGETVVASATFLVDSESNLRTVLGGMGDMPGMEITTPPSSAPPRERR